MKYQMNIEISNEKEQKVVKFNLDCYFSHDENTYGNGWFLKIKGDNFSPMCFDLRYDTSFKVNHKEKWLQNWAENYWNGDCNYTLTSCKIFEI